MPEHDRGVWLVWMRDKNGVARPTIEFSNRVSPFFGAEWDPAEGQENVVHTRLVLLHEMQLLPPGQGVLAERLGRQFPLPPPDQRTP
jgi:hypothetical protein